MSTFIQIHTLTAYPSSCLNRDIAGRPKTAIFGGVERLRISSQSLKRALRVSPAFQTALTGHLGERTREFREEVRQHLLSKGVSEDRAAEVAQLAGAVFSAPKNKGGKDGEAADTGNVLSFIAPGERAAIYALAEKAAQGEEVDFTAKSILNNATDGVDVALFGRFLTDTAEVKPEGKKKAKPKKGEPEDEDGGEELNVAIPKQERRHAIVEAACQVAHALTTHKANVETDFWSAVDDSPYAKSGAGHIDEAYFGSGVFYGYWCINFDLLVRNLGGNSALALKAVEALIKALPNAAPSGKATSFAHHVRPALVLVERDKHFPRSLADAFVTPVRAGTEQDIAGKSIDRLLDHRGKSDAQWGTKPERTAVLISTPGRTEGAVSNLIAAARGEG